MKPVKSTLVPIQTKPAPETTFRMKAVRQRDTKPEQAVRSILRGLGAHYRICPKDLPGRPDVANKSRKWCVFVNGCFWHGHDARSLASLPKTNSSWWANKIDGNRARDTRKEKDLRALGYEVVTVWQCELKDAQQLKKRLRPLAERSTV